MRALGAQSGQPIPTAMLAKSLDDRIDKSGDCWEWTGYTIGQGTHAYGRVFLRNRGFLAHRVVYEQLIGPIPQGMTLDHLCRNRLCVNPSHLEPVSHAENVRRGAVLRTHCPHGHPYDDTNTYFDRRLNARRCRICLAATNARYLARKAS